MFCFSWVGAATVFLVDKGDKKREEGDRIENINSWQNKSRRQPNRNLRHLLGVVPRLLIGRPRLFFLGTPSILLFHFWAERRKWRLRCGSTLIALVTIHIFIFVAVSFDRRHLETPPLSVPLERDDVRSFLVYGCRSGFLFRSSNDLFHVSFLPIELRMDLSDWEPFSSNFVAIDSTRNQPKKKRATLNDAIRLAEVLFNK